MLVIRLEAKMFINFVIILFVSPVRTTFLEDIVRSKGTDDPGDCILPPYPEHGNYTSITHGLPGDAFDMFSLDISCFPGYGVIGKKFAGCLYGNWHAEMPKCVRMCKLEKHPSVIYNCPVKENDFVFGSKLCGDREPAGIPVRPQCAPNHNIPRTLPDMKCDDGRWNYIAVCNKECGKMTLPGDQLTVGANGYAAFRGQFPWHAGVYKKTSEPYRQICGGTLVRTTVILSAAHCFWGEVEKKLPAANYAVAVGKLYREWDNSEDKGVQKSDVKDIRIPPRYQGNVASYQDDLAIVIAASPFSYTKDIRPVCLNFDYELDKKQLQKDKYGKVAGWGLTEKGVAAPILTVLNLPYVEIETCIAESPPEFRTYITSDKICAGYKNGTALCKGDSGGGLSVLNADEGDNRYYLRGVVSTAPRDGSFCNTFTYTAFTHIFRHEHFIKENI